MLKVHTRASENGATDAAHATYHRRRARQERTPHIGAIVSVATHWSRDSVVYRERLAGLPSLSHLTVEAVHIGQEG